ncbi:MAG: DUF4070 domain-containing protein [Verrucomicrobia bacterium]|nr:DUF4070 domain-containing protein [Verrucomicrobiota bacterium]
MKTAATVKKRVLLAAPEIPLSFWSFRETNRMMGAKTLLPPLGLITVAALLPREWELRLVDVNIRPIRESEWDWAEIVMLSAMLVQQRGMRALISEAKRRGKVVVAGGPYPSSVPGEVLAAGCDFLVQGEAELAMPQLVTALLEGSRGQVIASAERPPLNVSPVPRYDLLERGAYGCVSLQTSRGCPFDCEFCDVIHLYGRAPRYKSPEQFLAELAALQAWGWRGDVFVADDNFIGHKGHARALLEAMIPWMEAQGKPFSFITQASVNLGQDKEMIDLMTAANFGFVFLGVESPDEDVLKQAHKRQNLRDPLVESLRAINRNGITAIASFVLGLDGERSGAGRRIAALVETAGIPLVALNILQSLPNTALWERLRREGRLRELASGDTTGPRLNFVPSRPEAEVIDEYLALWDELYAPRRFYERAHRNVLEMRPTRRALGQALAPGGVDRAAWLKVPSGHRRGYWATLWRLFWRRAIFSRDGVVFWRLTWDVFRRNPSRLRRFLIICALGENLFPLRSLVRRQAAG